MAVQTPIISDQHVSQSVVSASVNTSVVKFTIFVTFTAYLGQ